MSIYNEGLEHGSARYLANVIKCALLAPTYTPDVDHVGYSAISGDELSSAGYTAGGVALSSKTSEIDNAADVAHQGAADVEFGTITSGTIRYGVIYDETADLLLRVIDFGSDRVLSASTVTLRFTNARILTRQAA